VARIKKRLKLFYIYATILHMNKMWRLEN